MTPTLLLLALSTVACQSLTSGGNYFCLTTTASSNAPLYPAELICWANAPDYAGSTQLLGQERRGDVNEYARGDVGAHVSGSTTVSPVVNVLPRGRQVVSVRASDAGFACVIDDLGNAGCFGEPESGRLGDEVEPTTKDGWRRVPLRSLPGSTDVDGNVVPAPPDLVIDLCVGKAHACAISSVNDKAQLHCWGSNEVGQLGYNSSVSTIGQEQYPASFPPVDLPTGLSARQVVCGDDHTCVLLDNKLEVICWGRNDVGQLGFVSSENVVYNATDAQTLALGNQNDLVLSLTAGRQHTCAHFTLGGLRCWGNGLFGRLGTGSSTNVGTAANPLDEETEATDVGSKVTQLVAGPLHTCALLEDNSTLCFGRQVSGSHAAGTATTQFADSPPVAPGFSVPTRGRLTSLAAAVQATCVVDECTCVFCAGNGDYVGTGRRVTVGATPWGVQRVHFHFPLPVQSITSGQFHHCVTFRATEPDGDRGVSCWGRDLDGQLGYEGGANYFPTVHRVRGSARAPPVVHVIVEFSESSASRDSDDGRGGGYLLNSTYTMLPLPPPLLFPVGLASVHAGSSHTCLHVNTSAHCFGSNGFGQILGSATSSHNSSVVGSRLDILSEVHGLAVGRRVSCFIVGDDRRVACIGRNDDGELGLGHRSEVDATPGEPLQPVVGLPSSAIDVCFGNTHGCAIFEGSTVQCWGDNSFRQLGRLSTEDNEETGGDDEDVDQHLGPLVDLEEPLSSLSCGAYHTCMIVGTVPRCWGLNSVSQLGHSDQQNVGIASTIPLTTFAGARRIAAGAQHTCVADVGGSVFCFGSGRSGALGSGSTDAVDVSGLKEPVSLGDAAAESLSAGTGSTCAVTEEGDVQCWGLVEYGDVRRPADLRPARVTGSTDLTCDPTHSLPPPLDAPPVGLSAAPGLEVSSAVDVGDIDGDGVHDVAVTVVVVGTNERRLLILTRLADALASNGTNPFQAAVSIEADSPVSKFSVASPGDVNGDDLGDLLISWSHAAESGRHLAMVPGSTATQGPLTVNVGTTTSTTILDTFDASIVTSTSAFVVAQADGTPAVPVLPSGPPIKLQLRDGDSVPVIVYGSQQPPRLFVGLRDNDGGWVGLPSIVLAGQGGWLVSITSVGDVSGDGIDDMALIVGTGPLVRDTAERSVVLLFGRQPFDSDVFRDLAAFVENSTEFATLTPDSAVDVTSTPNFLVWKVPHVSQVVGLGDVDGDGSNDMWLEVWDNANNDVEGWHRTRGGILLYGGRGMTEGYQLLHDSFSPFARRFRWRVHVGASSPLSPYEARMFPVGDLDNDGRDDVALVAGVGNRDLPLAQASLPERVLLLSHDVWTLHNWYDALAGEVWEDRETAAVQVLQEQASFVMSLGPTSDSPDERERGVLVLAQGQLKIVRVTPSPADSPATPTSPGGTFSATMTPEVTTTSAPATGDDGAASDSAVALIVGLVGVAVFLVAVVLAVAYVVHRRRSSASMLPQRVVNGSQDLSSVRAGPAPRSVSRTRSRHASVSRRPSVPHLSRPTEERGTADSVEMQRQHHHHHHQQQPSAPMARYDQIPVQPAQRTAYGETSLTDASGGGGLAPNVRTQYGETSLYTPTVLM